MSVSRSTAASRYRLIRAGVRSPAMARLTARMQAIGSTDQPAAKRDHSFSAQRMGDPLSGRGIPIEGALQVVGAIQHYRPYQRHLLRRELARGSSPAAA